MTKGKQAAGERLVAFLIGCAFTCIALAVAPSVWPTAYGLQPTESAAPKASSLEPQASSLAITAPAKVIAVVDGDTLEVEFTVRSRVRLPRCWAHELDDKRPEIKKAAYLAKMNLASHALGKWGVVHVSLDGKRRLGDLFTFDRLVADVTLAGDAKPLSVLQVEAGHASSTKGGPLGK